MTTGNLFNEVDLDVEIDSEGWGLETQRRFVARRAADFQRLEQLHDLFGLELDAENLRHAVQTQADLARRLTFGGDFDNALADVAGFHLVQDLGAAIDGLERDADIGTALEAFGGFGVQALALGRAAHAHRLEPGAFEQHRCRRLAHLSGCAAHDASDPDGAIGVRDNQIFGIELAVDVVERLEHFAVCCTADMNGRQAGLGAQRREIIGVQRLTELEQDVVRRIDNVVD